MIKNSKNPKTICNTHTYWEKWAYFNLMFHGILHQQGKSGQELSHGRNMVKGDDVETMDGYCLLVCSPWLAHPAFIGGHHTKSWALLHESPIKKMYHRLIWRDIFLNCGFFFQMTIDCVKLK